MLENFNSKILQRQEGAWDAAAQIYIAAAEFHSLQITSLRLGHSMEHSLQWAMLCK